MINKFKITRLPERALLQINGVDVVLNQEYSIVQQADLVATVYNRGEPYDNFGYRLGNSENILSAEINCIINALVNTGTDPSFLDLDIDVDINVSTDILSSFVFDDFTDRVKFTAVVNIHGQFLINGEPVISEQWYMLYEIETMEYVSIYSGAYPNVYDFWLVQVGNAVFTDEPVELKFNLTANLFSNFIGTTTLTGNLTAL